jgi:hypothetical protein
MVDMRRWLVCLIVLFAAGCGQSAYQSEREKLRGIERAENEQAMRDYPTAGITPDMPRAEREKRISHDGMRRLNEVSKTFSDMEDAKNLPPDQRQKAIDEAVKKANEAAYGTTPVKR